MDAQAVQQRFAPVGQPQAARWQRKTVQGIDTLTFDCPARLRCYAVPYRAVFRFVKGQLADAELTLDAVHAPDGVSPQTTAAAQLSALGPPAIRSDNAGRRTRYYVGKAWTVAWTIDGPDGRVVLAADAISPVTRAEAVAAGAPADGLAKLAGADAYAQGHAAIAKGDLAAATKQFEATLATPKAAPLLTAPTRLVLAMVLAARAKRAGRLDAQTRAWLRRAEVLAPQLKADLAGLRATLAP